MNANRPTSSLAAPPPALGCMSRVGCCAWALRRPAACCASAVLFLAACCASAVLFLAAGCASAPTVAPTAALTPERLYPMVAGSAWSYDVDAGEGPPVLAISRVTEAGGGRVTVQGGEGATHYELRPDGIFRTERGGYLLKAPIRAGAQWPSGGGMQATVQRVGVGIDIPAGRFSDCVEVLEQGSASGAVISTTYCPEVGPAQVISSMQLQLGHQTVRVVARLRGYRVGPETEPQGSPEVGAGPSQR
jgi:hypothetical protein